MLGEHQHPHLRVLALEAQRGDQALVGVGGRHAHVDDRELGPVPGHLLEKLLAVADGGEHLDTLVLQQAAHALAQQHGVIGEDDAQRASGLSHRAPPR